MLAGYVEPSHFNDFQFENQRRTFHSYGELFWLVVSLPVWFAVSFPFWLVGSFPVWFAVSFPVWFGRLIPSPPPCSNNLVNSDPSSAFHGLQLYGGSLGMRALKTWRGSVNVVDDSCVAQFSIWYLNWPF